MAQFRKKPVVIEATKASDEIAAAKSANWSGLTPWIEAALKRRQVSFTHDAVLIKTLEGTMRANPDDMIIKGVKGELYPCKSDIFEATYDVVEASAGRWTELATWMVDDIMRMEGEDVRERGIAVLESYLSSFTTGEEARALREAVGMLVGGLYPELDMNIADPVGMARDTIAHVTKDDEDAGDGDPNPEELAGERDRANVYAKGWREVDTILGAGPTEGLQAAAERVVGERDTVREAAERVLRTGGAWFGDMTEKAAEDVRASDFMSAMENLSSMMDGMGEKRKPGRPPGSTKVIPKVRCSLSIDKDVLKSLDAMAEAYGMSRSAMVERALKTELPDMIQYAAEKAIEAALQEELSESERVLRVGPHTKKLKAAKVRVAAGAAIKAAWELQEELTEALDDEPLIQKLMGAMETLEKVIDASPTPEEPTVDETPEPRVFERSDPPPPLPSGSTEEERSDPRFEAIFQLIKGWDVDADGKGYQGANGSHVAAIMHALDTLEQATHATPATRLIAHERQRQILDEGYTHEHDDGHKHGSMAIIGATLAIHGTDAYIDDPHEFVTHDGRKDMWGLIKKHGNDEARCLAIGGALIAAELDRVLRRDGYDDKLVGIGVTSEAKRGKLRELADDFLGHWTLLPPLVRASVAIGVWEEMERRVRFNSDRAVREKLAGIKRRGRVTALHAIGDGRLADFMAALANHADAEAENKGIDDDIRYQTDGEMDPYMVLVARAHERDPSARYKHLKDVGLTKTWTTEAAEGVEKAIAMKVTVDIGSELDTEVFDDMKKAASVGSSRLTEGQKEWLAEERERAAKPHRFKFVGCTDNCLDCGHIEDHELHWVILWEDKETSAKLIRTPEFDKPVWYVDVGYLEPGVMAEKLPGVIARYKRDVAETDMDRSRGETEDDGEVCPAIGCDDTTRMPSGSKSYLCPSCGHRWGPGETS